MTAEQRHNFQTALRVMLFLFQLHRGVFVRRFGGLRSVSSTSPVDYVTVSKRATDVFCESPDESTINVTLVFKSKFHEWFSQLPKSSQEWFQSYHPHSTIPAAGYSKIPDFISGEQLHVVILSDVQHQATYKEYDTIWGSLQRSKKYMLIPFGSSLINRELANSLCLSWGLYFYDFSYFRSQRNKLKEQSTPVLVWPAQCASREIMSLLRANYLMRDLVNSPAIALGPEQLEEVARAISKEFNCSFHSIIGVQELIDANFPQVAAVGMGAAPDRQPRLVDMKNAEKKCCGGANSDIVTLIGKGVMFDTGGLNLKPGGSMRHMKKDMAGAAQALAVFMLLLESNMQTPVRLLLPIVENSISATAIRPGDIIRARNGITTEVTNTDAEGRLVLADALVAATEEGNGSIDECKTQSINEVPPSTLAESSKYRHLIVDFATLTGAARVALGTDVAALFSNKDLEARRLCEISISVGDPLWHMPLWKPYRKMLKSDVADIVNSVEGGLAGAITAALYLSEFVALPNDTSQDICWFHIDFSGTSSNKLAAANGLHAVYEYIKRYHQQDGTALDESGPPGS